MSGRCCLTIDPGAKEAGTKAPAAGRALTREDLLKRPLAKKNLAALAAAGQQAAARWILEAPSSAVVAELEGEGGAIVLSVSGQTQASPKNPGLEAERWLEKLSGRMDEAGGPALLFGFGSPWAAEMMLRRGPLTVYEPEPLVLLAVLSRHDFSADLASSGGGRLRLLTPGQLASGWRPPPGGSILVHPPAQRRAAAQLGNLRKAFQPRRRALAALAGRPLGLMIIPPVSGGSWSVAASLARAAAAGPHRLCFLDWDDDLRQLEAQAHQGGPEAGPLTGRLFAEAGRKLLAAAAAFKPDLVIALAQAPLDAPTLGRLRESLEAPLAFWLVEDFRHFPYVAEVAPAYDLLFHIQKGGLEPGLPDWGLGESVYLPLAADAAFFKLRPEVPPAYRAELSFMGAGYPNRRRLLGRLAEDYWPSSGRPAGSFKVFGSGWEGSGDRLRAHLFEGGRRVSEAECALIYAGGRVNLNIHSSFSAWPEFAPDSLFVNPRTFEIAAAGAFQLVDARPLLPELFTAGRELAVVEEPAALPDLIEYYLRHPDEAEAMGAAARRRVLAEHTYGRRLESILAALGWRAEVGEG